MVQPYQPVSPPSTQRFDANLRAPLMSLIRIAGSVTGVSAFVLAGLAIFDPGDAAVLLTAAGGFGALAFGTAQVHNQLGAAEAATRRARMKARLIRRSLVEMVNGGVGILMSAWIDAIGSSRSLDPVQQFFNELVDLTAPLGGWQADTAERAFSAFLIAADRINGLRSRLPTTSLREFEAKDLARKGRILGALIASIDNLSQLGAVGADEPRVKDEVLANAEALDQWFGIPEE